MKRFFPQALWSKIVWLQRYKSLTLQPNFIYYGVDVVIVAGFGGLCAVLLL